MYTRAFYLLENSNFVVCYNFKHINNYKLISYKKLCKKVVKKFGILRK